MNQAQTRDRKASVARMIADLSIVVLIGFLLCCLLGSKARAFSSNGYTAIGPNAPQLGSADDAKDGNVQPWFVVGSGDYNKAISYAKIYVPYGRSATLHILQKPDSSEANYTPSGTYYCGGVSFGDASANYQVYQTFSTEDIWVSARVKTIDVGATDCNNTITINLPKSGVKDSSKNKTDKTQPSSHTGHQEYTVYYFEATKEDPNKNCDGSPYNDCERGFRLQVTMDDNNEKDHGYIGMSRPSDDTDLSGQNLKRPFGVAMRNIGGIDNGINGHPAYGHPDWDFAVQYAPMCDEDPEYLNDADNQKVIVNDIDYTLYGQINGSNLTGQIQSALGTSIDWGDPLRKKVDSAWDLGPTGDGNNAKDYLGPIKGDTAKHYLLTFKNLSWRNAVQIGLPFDQFDAQTTVRALCPPVKKPVVVDCTAKPPTSAPNTGDPAVVTVTVASSGLAGFGNGKYFYIDPADGSASQDVTKSGSYSFTVTNSNGSSSQTFSYTVRIKDAFNTDYPPDQYALNSAADRTCSATVNWNGPPPNKPYFQTRGGDIFTGGAFITKQPNGTETCDATNYQALDNNNFAKTKHKGGIYAFANQGVGAQSKYAAFALGNIDGGSDGASDAMQYGFYSYGVTTPIQLKQSSLSFSNRLPSGVSGSGYWGGYFEGTTLALRHCVEDYFSSGSGATPANMPDIGSASGRLKVINSGAIPMDVTSSGAKIIKAGQNLVVYVAGDAYISHNITYANSSSYGPNNVPEFALIVQGNIYIDQSVTQLDGLYVAQPSSNVSGTGIIWTCSNNGAAHEDANYVKQFCQNKSAPNSPSLTFNGAVIAKQINLWRVNDGLNSALPNVPAEVFNYTPEMVMGSPLSIIPNAGTQTFQIESVTSLPPIF